MKYLYALEVGLIWLLWNCNIIWKEGTPSILQIFFKVTMGYYLILWILFRIKNWIK